MLEEHGTMKKYNSGDMVFKQGDKGNEMYIIRSGKVKIFRTGKGREVELATLGPSEFFGEMALFGNHARSASARVEGNAEIQVVDAQTFKSFIKEPIVWAILEKMSEVVREIDDKLEELSVQDQLRKEHLSNLVNRNRWLV